MVQSPELRTSVKQRIGVIIVAIVLLGSTIALYAGLMVSYNSGADTAVDPVKQARFDELYAEYQSEVDAKAAELSTVQNGD